MIPWIGLTISHWKIEQGPRLGEERAGTNRAYIEAVRDNGGYPLLLPMVDSVDEAESQVDLIQGLLLTGGSDIHPHHFKEELLETSGYIYPLRDLHEIMLILACIRKAKPILALCRGMQALNVALGGSLYQDLSEQPRSIKVAHEQKAPVQAAAHDIVIERESLLFHLLQKSFVAVNSFHHQSIKQVAPCLKATARSRDGVIEALEHKDRNFVVGVQWHPELLRQTEPLMNGLFATFIKKAAL